jgi:hypothetical protein
MKALFAALLLSACGGFSAGDAPHGRLAGALPALDAPNTPNSPDALAPAPVAHASGWATWNAFRGDAYELDEVQRHLENDAARPVCQPDAMVDYGGTNLRYYGTVKISPLFQQRLERFEDVVRETAIEIYGRAPRRIRHYGAFSCRTSRNRNYRLSEHALGNAIDIVGFDFASASKDQTLVASVPKQLRGAFEVRVSKHWNADKGVTAPTHARFLRVLIERLQERENIFRGVIGPGHPGHSDHFHFDMSPWRYVRP